MKSRGWIFGRLSLVQRLLLFPVLIAGLVAMSFGAVVNAEQHSGTGNSGVPHLKHVFVIMMENHSYSDIMYENDLPYIHYLARTYGLATQYYGITNASTPDRVGLLSGTTSKLDLPGVSGHGLSQPTIVNQLMDKNMSWGVYYQHSRFSTTSAPQYNYPGGGGSKAGTFFRFNFIANNPQLVAEQFHPLRLLGQQLASKNANAVPQFVWIRPNSLGNMEGGFRPPGQFTFQGAGPGGAGSVDAALEQGGNNFLATLVPEIMKSKAWHSGPSAIFIQFDETSYDASMPQNGFWASNSTLAAGSPTVSSGTVLGGANQFPFPGGVNGGGHALALVITNTARHVVSSTPYNEYSVLRTIEQGFGLSYLDHAGSSGVHSMAALFHGGSGAAPAHPQASGMLPALSGNYQVALGATPVTTAARPSTTTTAGVATVSATSDPYFAASTSDQAATTVTIQELAAGVLTKSVTLRLVSPQGVQFSTYSSPVGTTALANPNATGTEFAPSLVTSSQVTLPVVQTSTTPSTAVVTGLLVNVPSTYSAGPVTAAVSSGGVSLGTVVLGTVGRPAAAQSQPIMMAPVVLGGRVAFPFVAARDANSESLYTIEIEGVNPATASGPDTNQFFTAKTHVTTPVVGDTTAELTALAGKQYWVRARLGSESSAARGWSVPATFAALTVSPGA
ncbi:MAG: alkaline phosphatase family protein [Candidatus Dormibacteria bacterium]